jgi:hypothetical protein
MPAQAGWLINIEEQHMTVGEKIEANANLLLWCVHVLGPDDVLAAPSHDAAATHAHELNKAVLGRVSAPDDVLCFAYAAPWPYSAEAHTEAVKSWLK